MGPGRKPPVFFGWHVVASGFLLLFTGFGVVYTFGAFLDPLRHAFGADKAAISGLFSVTGALYFTLGAVSGPLSDRYGPRRIVGAGAALTVLGLLLASRANALWQLYVFYCGGVGVGLGFMYVPAVSAVQQWFRRRRGFATGLAVAGIGAGTLAGPPLAEALIAATGWRTTYLLLGLGAAVGLAVALLRMEARPAARGLAPDGEAPGVAPVAGVAVLYPEDNDSPVYSTAPFWLLYFSCLFCSLALFVPFVHLDSYARAEGISSSGAAWILGLIGVGSFSGRLFLGTAADRLGRRRSLGGAYGLMAVMMVWWLVSHAAWQLAIFSLLFGLGYGGFVALFPAITADYFGAARAGAIIGRLYTSAAVGNLIGPVIAGDIYDQTGHYTIAIAAGVAVNLLAVACIVALRPPARRIVAARPLAVPAAE
ncbi:MAG TPA: MFS transporter [Dehalococcoidia bacterium]|nr:MFS transporter [Dehalococcoidia bacterium]